MKWKEIAIFKIDTKVEGNSIFEIAISFLSSIFGKMGEKMEWNGMKWQRRKCRLKDPRLTKLLLDKKSCAKHKIVFLDVHDGRLKPIKSQKINLK